MCSVKSSSYAKFSLKCNNIYGFFLTKTLFHKTFLVENDLRTKKMSEMSFWCKIYFEKWYYTLFSVGKKTKIIRWRWRPSLIYEWTKPRNKIRSQPATIIPPPLPVWYKFCRLHSSLKSHFLFYSNGLPCRAQFVHVNYRYWTQWWSQVSLFLIWSSWHFWRYIPH